MDLSEFWQLIDSGRTDPDVVLERIRKMSEQELVDFWWLYQDVIDEITEPEYGEVFGTSYSEDHHEDVASWVVQQGKAYYDEIVANPSQFPLDVPAGAPPSYRGEAAEVYDDRYDEPIREPDEAPPANA